MGHSLKLPKPSVVLVWKHTQHHDYKITAKEAFNQPGQGMVYQAKRLFM
jgi:hypothetical protein